MVAKTSAKAASAAKNGKSKNSAAHAAAAPAKRSDPPEADLITSGESTVSEQSEGHDTGNSLATESVCDTSADGSKIYSKPIASEKEVAADKKCGEILTSAQDQDKEEVKSSKKDNTKEDEEAKHGEDAVADVENKSDGNGDGDSEEEPHAASQEEKQQDGDNEEEGYDEEYVEEVKDEEGNEEGEDDEEECDDDEYDDEDAEDEEGTTSTTETRRRGRPSSCVFVASLSAMHSDDHLCKSVHNHFKQWGEITLVKVLRDQVNRPYAFVQYTNDRDAASALAGAQHNTLDGRTIRCEPARVNRTLFVTPLNDDLANESTVEEFLGQYGELEELVYSNFAPGGTKKHHSWFAKFAYRDDAIRAYAVSVVEIPQLSFLFANTVLF